MTTSAPPSMPSRHCSTPSSAGDDEAAERVAQTCAGQTALLPALRPLLADAEPDRRWWAVRTLAVIGGEEAGALLMSRLSDPDEATRCAAALGLGQLRATAAIPALTAQLGDANGWVRDTAADALAMIGEPALPALVETLNDWPGWAPRAGGRRPAEDRRRRPHRSSNQ